MTDKHDIVKPLDEQHWRFKDYAQRITSKEWRKRLLYSEDTIIFEGDTYWLKATNLGLGVIEITKGHPTHKMTRAEQNKEA